MWFWRRKRKTVRVGDNALETLPMTRKVLLLAGGNNASVAAARFALQLSAQTGAQVLAIYVVDTDSLDFLQSKGIFVEEECREFGNDLEIKGNRYLDRIKRSGEEYGVNVETELVRGRFVKSVIGMVKSQDSDMVVMGGWETGLHAMDIAARLRKTVIDAVDCPVVVVKE